MDRVLATGEHRDRVGLLDHVLEQEPTRPVAVIARRGFGKTALLEQWMAERPHAPTSVSLADGAVRQALEAVIAEQRAAGAGRLPLDEAVVAELAPGGRTAAEPMTVGLVLDDVHRADTPGLVALVRALLARWTGPGPLVLVGRPHPELGLARAAYEGTVVVIEEVDLRYRSADLASLAADRGVDDATVAAEDVIVRTGGWPAAAIALARGDASIDVVVQREVLDPLSPTVRLLLEDLAVLERVALADAAEVLDRRDAAAACVALADEVPLVDRIDGGEAVVVRPVLVAALAGGRDDGGDARTALLRRAAAVAEGRGDLTAGWRYLTRAGDRRAQVRYVVDHAEEMVIGNRSDELADWLATFTPELNAAHPGLALAHAGVGLVRRDDAGTRRWLAVALAASRALPPETRRRVEAAAALMMESLGGQPLRSRDRPDDSGLGSSLHLTHQLTEAAMAHGSGDPRTARWLLLQAGPRMRELPILEAIRLALLAQLAIDAGAWDAAREAVVAARAAVDDGADSNPWRFPVDAVAAKVAVHDRDRAEATAAVDRASAVLAQPPWQGARIRAWSLMDLADAQVFLWRLGESEELLASTASLLDGLDHADALRSRHRNQVRSLRPLFLAQPDPAALTAGERRVLDQLPSHLSLVEVAAELEVSRNTVKHHVNALYRKLGAHDRKEAVGFARRLGLLP